MAGFDMSSSTLTTFLRMNLADRLTMSQLRSSMLVSRWKFEGLLLVVFEGLIRSRVLHCTQALLQSFFPGLLIPLELGNFALHCAPVADCDVGPLQYGQQSWTSFLI